jgi:hypothetical protein
MQHWYVIYPFDVALNAAYVYHTDRVYQISLYMLNLNERRVLTYAAGLKAMAIVWIARKFTSEHRAALDWLNEITHGEIYCFGLEIELWRIGESAMAPKLNVVCQPNDWSNRVQPPPPAVPTEVGQFYQAYWTEFKSYMDKNSTLVKARQPSIQNWAEFAIGRTDFSLQIWLGFEKKRLDISLVIKNTTTKAYYHLLQMEKDEIESILGPLDWFEAAAGKWSYISQRSETVDPQNRDQWPEQFAWLKERLEAFHRVFAPRVKTLRLDSGEQ